MQAFTDASLRNKDLYLLNIMRMALKVVTIADIDDRKILHQAFLLQSVNQICDRYDWPRDPFLETLTHPNNNRDIGYSM